MFHARPLFIGLCCAVLFAGSAAAAPADINSREVKLSYPQVYSLGEAGQKINQFLFAEIDGFFAKTNAEFNKSSRQDLPPRKLAITVDHTVTFNESPLLSLTVNEWFFSGGAHPMSYLRAYTFDTRTGERLTLADLFRADADYRSRLDEIMAAQIAERKIAIFSFTPFAGVKDNQEFYLTKEGLVVYYQLYEYTPYAAGFLRFPIPYAAVADLLKADWLTVLAPPQP